MAIPFSLILKDSSRVISSLVQIIFITLLCIPTLFVF